MAEPCTNCDENCVPRCNPFHCGCVSACGDCCIESVKLVPCKTYERGTILGMRSSDGLFDAYNPSAPNAGDYGNDPADPNKNAGLNYPRGVLRDTVNVDCEGKITYGDISVWPTTMRYEAEMYISGTHKLEETVGDLASAINTPGFGRLILGNIGGQGYWKLL